MALQAHYSLKKAGLFLGIGMNNVIPIPTDNAGHMMASALDRQMEKDKAEVELSSGYWSAGKLT